MLPPSAENLKLLIAAGAIKCGVATTTKYNRTSGQWDLKVPWPAHIHYFNASGLEIGLCSHFHNEIMWFNPPRVWADSFKDNLIMNDIYYFDNSLLQWPEPTYSYY